MEKKCETCGAPFQKRPRDSLAQWLDRAFCSTACANKLKKLTPPHLSYWKHVDKRGHDDCWPWNGLTDITGYGLISFATSNLRAHRVAYEMAFGPFDPEFVICHQCDNPNCVNPSHLFIGSQKDNMQDASTKGRLNPKSLMNLRPGAKRYKGAGPSPNKEIKHGG